MQNDRSPRDDARQEVVLLLVGAVAQDVGAALPVGGPVEADRRAGGQHLLDQHVAFERGALVAAVLLRPGHADPAALGHLAAERLVVVAAVAERGAVLVEECAHLACAAPWRRAAVRPDRSGMPAASSAQPFLRRAATIPLAEAACHVDGRCRMVERLIRQSDIPVAVVLAASATRARSGHSQIGMIQVDLDQCATITVPRYCARKVAESFMSEPSGPQPGYRALWSSVVLQALEDIESQPIESAAFAEAVAFFTRSGAWAEARTMIGDFLELHRDELESIGRRCIDARHARDRSAAETLRRSTNMRYDSPLRLARMVPRRRSARPRAFHAHGPRRCRKVSAKLR